MTYDNHDVRRQDRLLTEEKAFQLLREGEYGTLSLLDPDGRVYGIPVNYVWDGSRSLYIHCAPEGRKLRCIEAHKEVSFCVVGKTQVYSQKFTTAYESIVLSGKASMGLPESERRRALEMILDKYSPDDKAVGQKYAEKSFHRTEIIRIDIDTMSGKSKVIR